MCTAANLHCWASAIDFYSCTPSYSCRDPSLPVQPYLLCGLFRLTFAMYGGLSTKCM
eukprot:COSAG05_NODE_4180_length_1635_cov_1.715495_1_plen_56_part_10